MWITGRIFEGSALSSAPLPWVVLWIAAGLATLSSLMLAALPCGAWERLVRSHWKPLLFANAAGVAVMLVGHWSSALWESFHGLTFWAVRWVLGLCCGDVLCRPSEFLLGTPHFQVEIAAECSGYQGIGLIVAFLAVCFWWFRRELRFPQAFLLVPLGMALSWAFNVLRIAALVIAGDQGWTAVATGGFHSQAGWLAFNGIALGLVVLSRRMPFFSRIVEPSRDLPAAPANPTAAYVAPLLAIALATMITGALSEGGFDRLYAVRVLAGIAVLWHFRREYAGPWARLSWHGIAVGLAVFAIWTALEPPPSSAGASGAIRDGLARMPTALALAWLVARSVGSVIVVPVAEELAFRGYLTRRLIAADFLAVPEGRFRWPSFLLSSLLFGLLHQALARRDRGRHALRVGLLSPRETGRRRRGPPDGEPGDHDLCPRDGGVVKVVIGLEVNRPPGRGRSPSDWRASSRPHALQGGMIPPATGVPVDAVGRAPQTTSDYPAIPVRSRFSEETAFMKAPRLRSPQGRRHKARNRKDVPFFDQFEERCLLSTNGFIQGYVHDNSGDLLNGATVSLYTATPTPTFVTSTTSGPSNINPTNPNGYYAFSSVAPGTYDVVETQSNYSTAVGSIQTTINPAQVIDGNEIQVTVEDLSSPSASAVSIDWTTYATGALKVYVELNKSSNNSAGLNLYSEGGNNAPLNLTFTAQNTGTTVSNIVTYCTDLIDEISPNRTYNAVASLTPASTTLTTNIGELDYLYNTYVVFNPGSTNNNVTIPIPPGSDLTSNSGVNGNGLQLAMWALEYNQTGDLNLGDLDNPSEPFAVNDATGATAASIITAAKAYLGRRGRQDGVRVLLRPQPRE